jgi:antitoxin component of RelBE/YafQ-DinJ toxin-antitoxin module
VSKFSVSVFGSKRMNLTLSVDERTAEEARRAAQAMGKSLNQAVRDYLEQLAGTPDLAAELAAFEKSALASPGKRRGWKFDREEANRRA